jgi:hypothetical protein
MTVTVSMHLREGKNLTNFRSEAVAAGLEAAGAKIITCSRSEVPAEGADIVLQTGMNPTEALIAAIDEGIPYICAEMPAYRNMEHYDAQKWVSYGYGGLMGGGWRPNPPARTLWVPDLQPFKREGATIIFGQKLSDHSLRGQDHDAWISHQLERYPNAEFRIHPLMHPNPSEMEPLDECLARCHTAITFTSTVGAEALIAGCVSNPTHWGSSAYGVVDREDWLHELSWWNFPVETMATVMVGRQILSGLEEAKHRASLGLQEVPVEKERRADWTLRCDDPRVTCHYEI